ncbi:hypothetical protein Cgig2_022768 [Carnegiea gigantea]|uniref:Uncharacterized protein n=1 Tax=Carnegiea gigantea TaxID=171969 RepID=A0A9Q1KDP1_9CARY|nr:hypothetical protein Cgig2_022768 [Carnegiea gigantea]
MGSNYDDVPIDVDSNGEEIAEVDSRQAQRPTTAQTGSYKPHAAIGSPARPLFSSFSYQQGGHASRETLNVLTNAKAIQALASYNGTMQTSWEERLMHAKPTSKNIPDHNKYNSGIKPELLLDVENVKDVANHSNGPMIESPSKLVEEVIQSFQSHHSTPQTILSDSFLGCTSLGQKVQ